MAEVQVWSSQLAANDFPPVCAMTGRQAETWRKFTFSTPPAWAYALLVLVCLGVIGLLVAAAIIYAVSGRASGHLPLTRGSSRAIGLATWVPLSLILGAFVLMSAVVAAAIANVDAGDQNAGTIGGLLFLLAGFALALGLVGRLVIMRLVGPRGKVHPLQPGYYDRLVVVSNVNPVFVAAVQQHQHARAAQIAAPTQSPQLPEAK